MFKISQPLTETEAIFPLKKKKSCLPTKYIRYFINVLSTQTGQCLLNKWLLTTSGALGYVTNTLTSQKHRCNSARPSQTTDFLYSL